MNLAINRRMGANRWTYTASLAIRNPTEIQGRPVLLGSDVSSEGSWKQALFNTTVDLAALGASAVPKAVRMQLNIAIPSDIDVAIDVSGYCFGDHWGQGRVDALTKIYKKLKKGGALVILMPKTWGPFERISKDSLNRMLSFVDLAFARDLTSQEYLIRILNNDNQKKICFAPDYTHEIEVQPDTPRSSVAYIIPSSRVVDSGAMAMNDYIDLFRTASDIFRINGVTPSLLIHETSKDLSFVEVASYMGIHSDNIIIAEGPDHAKSVIAGAQAVVTSRLHGLYNALNCQIPVAAVAWSFKYHEALKQYNCPLNFVDNRDPHNSIRELSKKIIDPKNTVHMKEQMKIGKEECARLTCRMWEKIFDTIEAAG